MTTNMRGYDKSIKVLGGCMLFKTHLITKIRNTVHTAGINSFSMYRHLTRPFDGIPIPKQPQRQDSKASSRKNLSTHANEGNLEERAKIGDFKDDQAGSMFKIES